MLRLALLLTASVLLAPSSTPADEPVPRSEPTTTSDASIIVAPAKVYCGSRVRLRLEGVATASVSWQASGGVLLWDDTEEVDWHAPTASGETLVRATFRLPGEPRPRILETRLRIHPASRDGMVWIPSGTFTRGDILGTNDQREIKTPQNVNNEPFHAVHLDGYWIDKYPVTNRQYADFLAEGMRQGLLDVTPIAVMGDFDGGRVPFYYFQSYENLIDDFYATRNARVPTFLRRITWDGSAFQVEAGFEEHPIVDVTWFGSAAYARFYGKRLPTEAQWEKAARGGDDRPFPWGKNLPTVYHANLGQSYSTDHAPVGYYSPLGDSPYGVADMLSTCTEWTNDWFNIDFYQDYSGTEPLRNPEGPFWGESHTIRGAPEALNHIVRSILDLETVSARYDWRFEFLLGDSFANANTTFRTVIWDPEAPPAGPAGSAGAHKVRTPLRSAAAPQPEREKLQGED